MRRPYLDGSFLSSSVGACVLEPDRPARMRESCLIPSLVVHQPVWMLCKSRG
jgi:hypothetical protein